MNAFHNPLFMQRQHIM